MTDKRKTRTHVSIILAGAVIFCSRGVLAELPELTSPHGDMVIAANEIHGAIEWESENSYWRKAYPERPYYKSDTEYGIYEPAYHYGTEAFDRYNGKRFEDIDEAELRTGWDNLKDKSRLTWEQAKDAVKDAYNRVYDRYASKPSSND